MKKIEQIGMKMLKYVYDGSCSLKNLPEAEYRRNIETHFGLLLCKTSGLYALRSVRRNTAWLESCLKTL